MKRLGARIYFLIILVATSLIGWRLIDQKLIPPSIEHQLVALLPVKQQARVVIEPSFLEQQLSAQAYLAMDIDTRTVLLAKNLDTVLPPASTTKLMTALVALEDYNLNDIATVSAEVATDNDGGGLVANEQLTVRNLLIAALVSSANDAAYALAEHHSQGLAGFVADMNNKAATFGMTATHFENPTGYDDPPNVSTARDLSVLVLQAIKNPSLLEWISLEHYEINSINGANPHFLYTTNQLLGVDSRVIGGKTGTTALAREVLVTLVDVNGRQYIVIVMGTEDRYADTTQILDWLETGLEWQPISNL